MSSGQKPQKWEKTKVQFLIRNAQSGIYYARGFTGGKEVWKSLKTDVFSVAKERLPNELGEIRRLNRAVSTVESGQGTVGDASEIYLNSVRKTVGLKLATVHYREQLIKALFKSWPLLAQSRLKDVTERECLEWAKRFEEQSSPTRFNNMVDSLRAIFQIGIDKGLINRNPASKIGKRRPNAKHLKLPSSMEFAQLVHQIRSAGAWCSEACGDLVEFLAYSGCRKEEAATVSWPDVEEARNIIWIHGGSSGTKNHERRAVPIVPSMKMLLDSLRSRPRYFRDKKREEAGLILSVMEAQRAIDKACKKLGIPRITHHDLRHLFATRCIESGVDIPTVSRWLGHRDGGALAMRTYGHLRDEHSLAMAAKVSF